MNEIDTYISNFLKEVEFRKTVDYSDKKSVKQYNMAYERAADYVKNIDRYYPEYIPALINLLQHTDVQVVASIAPMILQMANSTYTQKQMALEAVNRLVADPRLNEVDRFGFQMNLERWKDMYKEI